MADKKLLLIGGGGHCRSVLDCLLTVRQYDKIGIIEREAYPGVSMLGVPVIGTDDDLPALFADGWTSAVITVGSVGNTAARRVLFQKLKQIGFSLPIIVDSSAVIGHGVSLGEGVFVGKRAVLNTGTWVDACAIINTGAILEHDCSVGAFAHISPGCVLCGEVSVGDGAHVGAGSVIRQQLQIGKSSLIGAGSVVIKDVADHVEAFGNPCRVVKNR